MTMPLHILQVNTTDNIGGAAQVARMLHREYKLHNFQSWLAVGYKRTNDPYILTIKNNYSLYSRLWIALGNLLSPLVGKTRGIGQLQRFVRLLGQPKRLIDTCRGYEDFNFPATWHLLDLPPTHPNIVHCHNLHGDYFNIQALSWLSQQVPLILTLHDAWLLSGHCAHSFNCDRWATGCGHCPDLTIPPLVWRDKTAYNWQRKHKIYAKSQFYVTTPSNWLMKKVKQSMLASAIVETKVIPNGVDTSIFKPIDKQVARTTLGLTSKAKILLFTASGIRKNVWKDYKTIQTAISQVAKQLNKQDLLFIALGEDAPPKSIGHTQIIFVPYQENPKVVASYYQSADIYLHAAHADTFPNTVLEALACGTPVIATAVGGIPEQIKGLQGTSFGLLGLTLDKFSPDEATGILVAPKNPNQMAAGIEMLLTNNQLLKQLSSNAVKDSQKRFNLTNQVGTYLTWYQNILSQYNFNHH